MAYVGTTNFVSAPVTYGGTYAAAPTTAYAAPVVETVAAPPVTYAAPATTTYTAPTTIDAAPTTADAAPVVETVAAAPVTFAAPATTVYTTPTYTAPTYTAPIVEAIAPAPVAAPSYYLPQNPSMVAYPAPTYLTYSTYPTYPTVAKPTPMATAGIDVNHDGRANYLVTGVDMNRDGIPDVLQQFPTAAPEPAPEKPKKVAKKPKSHCCGF